MGRELFYCAKCGTRLTGDDLTKGSARQVGEGTYCLACAPAAPEPASSAKLQAPRAALPVPSTTRRIAHEKAASRLPLAAGIVGGILVVALLIALATGSSSPPPPVPVPVPEAPPKRPPPKKDSATDDETRRMNETVAELRRLPKEDPAAAVRAWEEARGKFASPDWTELVDDTLQALRKQVAEAEAKKRLQPEDVADLWVRTKKAYTWHRAAKGDPLFTDRAYVLGEIPAVLHDALVLRGSNDDKVVKDFPLLRFELKREADVTLSIDPRAVVPAWLKGWEKLPETVPMSDRPLHLYRKRHPAGKVEVGGMNSPKTNSVSVFVTVPR